MVNSGGSGLGPCLPFWASSAYRRAHVRNIIRTMDSEVAAQERDGPNQGRTAFRPQVDSGHTMLYTEDTDAWMFPLTSVSLIFHFCKRLTGGQPLMLPWEGRSVPCHWCSGWACCALHGHITATAPRTYIGNIRIPIGVFVARMSTISCTCDGSVRSCAYSTDIN